MPQCFVFLINGLSKMDSLIKHFTHNYIELLVGVGRNINTAKYNYPDS